MGDAIDALDNVDSVKNIIVIGKADPEVKEAISVCDLVEDDGKSAPRKPDIDWERTTVYLPFTSTTSGSRGIGKIECGF